MKYEKKQIKDICEFIGGSQPPKSEFIHEPKEGYVRLIQTRDRLNDDFITFIPEKSTKKFCEPDDILIGRYGPPIFQIFRGFKGAYNVALMKANPINGVDKDYLYYFLLQPAILKYVDSMSSRTAGQTGVELDSLYEYPVNLPSSEQQKRIASLLLTIDEKIKKNNEIIDKLEIIAEKTYQYWFVQFEYPDQNGQPYTSAGNKLVWNDVIKRNIPSNWSVCTIEDKNVYTSDYTANGSFAGLADNVKYNEGDPYALLIRIVDFNKNFENEDDFIYVDKHAYEYLRKSELHGNEIIICNVGNAGAVYRCPEFDIPMTLGPNGVMVNSEKYNNYLSLYYKSPIGQQQLRSISSGSIQMKFNKTNFRDLPILFPDDYTLQKFEDLYSPIIAKQNKLWMDNRKLTKLRDYLIPLLMTGQIEIC